MDIKNELIDISIRIGNSHDWNLIKPGRTYNFRVYRNDTIGSLKKLFCECFDEPTQSDLKKYNIYNNKISLLHDNNEINDAFSSPELSVLDIIDRNEYLFYVILI